MPGMLYLVPTPIGNLGDISPRCRETLEQADFIAAEDTRVSLKLLNYLGIKKSRISYYEHNKATKGIVISFFISLMALAASNVGTVHLIISQPAFSKA